MPATDAGLTVVVPVGPMDPALLQDTIDSVEYYAASTWRLILVDDSGQPELCEGLRHAEHATIVPAVARGVGGGLYLNLSAGFRGALDEPFDILVRMDTDALAIGGGFERAAAEFFRTHPSVGCLGPYSKDYDGTPDDHEWARRELIKTMTVRWLRSPVVSARVSWLIGRALRHGYDLGEMVDGGVCIYSRAAIEALRDHGLLSHTALASTPLQEDFMFGLCLRACGMQLADFGSEFDSLPIGSRWRGLPTSPDNLVAAGKCLIHSTNFWQEMDEAAIRHHFAERRARHAVTP